jgi:hypothetical protein
MQWFARFLRGNASWKRERRIANGGVAFFFLREMRWGQRWELRTRALGCDAKWLYLRHEYRDPKCDVVFAVGMAKLVFKERGGRTVPPLAMLAQLGYALPAGLSAKGVSSEAAAARMITSFDPATPVGPLLQQTLEALAPTQSVARTPAPALSPPEAAVADAEGAGGAAAMATVAAGDGSNAQPSARQRRKG